jgi:hypothetical protein
MLLPISTDIHTRIDPDMHLPWAGGTALHLVCEKDHSRILPLLDHGAQQGTSLAAEDGRIPLMILITFGIKDKTKRFRVVEMINMLLAAGADPILRNVKENPLEIFGTNTAITV